MPDFLVSTISASAPDSIDVDTASKTIVSENLMRAGIVLQNLASGTVYLAFGTNSAVVGKGIALLPAGGNWNMDDYTFTKEAIQAIAHSDNSNLTIQEFVVRS